MTQYDHIMMKVTLINMGRLGCLLLKLKDPDLDFEDLDLHHRTQQVYSNEI